MDRDLEQHSTMPLPGDVISGKYRVEAVVGRGGMSVVYRSTHLSLEQQVAIKVLSAEALLLPEYVVRLKREARAVSQIRSEHVVRVHDIGELPNGGVPYLVMEYLAGSDLAAVLARRGPFPVPLAIECIMQACEALAEAHALGIVHRDLKPANLFLTEAVDGSPCVKLLDFGISRMSPRHGLTALTDPGIVLGTPSYMAPEQMEASDAVDARSDIWALGAILYELLVGKTPYHAASLPQLFIKIMRSKTPQPSVESPRPVPHKLDSVVARCLALEPQDRFQTVAELAWALSKVGTPHARDSAERISRVHLKHTADAHAADVHAADSHAANGAAPAPQHPTLPSTVPPVVNEQWRSRAPAKRSGRDSALLWGGAVAMGAALLFGWFGSGHRGAAPRELANAVLPRMMTAAATVIPEDGAVTIAPATRPREALVSSLPVALAPVSPVSPWHALVAPAAASSAHAALIAVSVSVSAAGPVPGGVSGSGQSPAATPSAPTPDEEPAAPVSSPRGRGDDVPPSDPD